MKERKKEEEYFTQAVVRLHTMCRVQCKSTDRVPGSPTIPCRGLVWPYLPSVNNRQPNGFPGSLVRGPCLWPLPPVILPYEAPASKEADEGKAFGPSCFRGFPSLFFFFLDWDGMACKIFTRGCALAVRVGRASARDVKGEIKEKEKGVHQENHGKKRQS